MSLTEILKTPFESAADPAATRRQLIEAAGEVFAEVGFHAATVRQICQRAGANVAAIHYHFGDKRELYREVLRHTQRLALEKYPLDHGIRPDATAAERLAAFVHAFLLRIFDPGPIAWHGRLIAREMIEPTDVLTQIIDEHIRPQAQLLRSIVAELLEEKPASERVRLCASSVVSQCLFYHHCRPVIAQLFPQQKFDPGAIEHLAKHITEFSLASLTQLGQGRARGKR